MPAIFFGHGNPLNALHGNAYARSWIALSAEIPRPKAVLCISAHWYMPATAVTAMRNPRTIHDFGGFPRALYEVQYPAPGSPDLARRVADLLAPTRVQMDEAWGLDHGAWSILIHAYPNADIPVVQLSMDETKPARWHYELAKRVGQDRLSAASMNVRTVGGTKRRPGYTNDSEARAQVHSGRTWRSA